MDMTDKAVLEPIGLQVKDAVKEILFQHLTKDKTAVANRSVLFMAGSPAAGKTEFINNVLFEGKQTNFVRIDADDFRWWFPYYNEKNSVCFQKPASKMVDYIYPAALAGGYQIIMDSTFASKGIAEQNFDMAIQFGYKILLNYVYFDPADAWIYAQKRTRLVPLDVLKRNFINGREVIKHVLDKYAGQFTLNVIHRQRDPLSASGFNVRYVPDVTKSTWEDSHHCPYSCVEDLAHIGV
ncbi:MULTISPECIES: zeta toxin family protein [unclassified Pantoea]|uniref:zeta toxin family protein n=2 Tax=Pantoea TaxID=53335 RepID=UPI001CC1EE28|nr:MULTISPECIES: zeta toxin family protein [unclassified Pantoea]